MVDTDTTFRDPVIGDGFDAATAAPMSRGARLAMGLLAAAGVGLGAWWLSRAVMIMLAPESQWVAPLPVRSTAVTQRTLPTINPEFDAFHRTLPTIEEPVDLGLDAPETTLNLVLKGHRAGPDGTAIIQTPDRSERNFYVDEEILAGVTLETVGRGFVVINRSGQLERLSQRDDEELFGEASEGRTPALDANARRRDQRDQTADMTPASVKPPANTLLPGQSTSPTNEMPDMSAVVAGDLLQNVSLSVVRDGDRIRGYRVSDSGNGGTPLSRFGLRSGDIVSKINGQDLTQGRPDLMALGEQLQRRPDATLVIERDGAMMTVRIGS